jgi:hypothetical protein
VEAEKYMDGQYQELEEICFQLLDSVLEPKAAVYVAGPLDSGQLYYESLVRGSVTAEVRHRNQTRLTRFAQDLRRKLPCPVIDPGLLKIRGWTGDDHGEFFLKVISRYAREAWFIDGWQYSTGAAKEFFFCLSHRIPCFDSSGSILHEDSGRALVIRAAEYVNGLGLDSSKLRSTIP